MAITTENKYIAYEEPRPTTITQYGVTTDLYGVTQDPFIDSLLLLETGDNLLQDSGSNILL